jgi:flagellar hook-associated protein 2
MGSTINFAGLTGIDTQAIVEALMQRERIPLQQLQEQQATIERKKAYFQDIDSKLSSLESAIGDLASASKLAAKKASSSSDSIEATATSFAQTGSYTISEVTNLATSHSEAFIAVSDQTAQFDAGTFFDFEVNGNSYSIDLTSLDASQQDLEGLRDEINRVAGDDVSAFILNTGDSDDPYKLILQSKETGEEARITNLSTDIDATTSSGVADFDTVGSEQVLGQNASFVFNGVTVERATNSVNDLIEGLTLELKDETTSNVTITVSSDSDSIKEDIEDFVSKYNAVNAIFQSEFTVNPETGFAGELSGDATLRGIQSNMQSLVVSGVADAEGNRYSLATVGIEVDKDTGNLSFDSSKFDEAMASDDKDLMLDLFTAYGTTTSNEFSYVSSNSESQTGAYDINITGYDGDGNVQGTFTLNGQVYTGVGLGQLLTGPQDSPAEGIKIKVDSGATGSLGTLNFSVGVAEAMERQIHSYTAPVYGLFSRMDSRFEDDIKLMEDQIADFELRLETTERNFRQQFLAAEEAMSALQSQQQAFAAQAANL